MAATRTILSAIFSGGDAAIVIAAVVTGFFALGARWFPRTRSEAALDQSSARLNETQSLVNTVEAQGRELTRAHNRVDELENALEEERRECDRRLEVLGAQVVGMQHELANFRRAQT